MVVKVVRHLGQLTASRQQTLLGPLGGRHNNGCIQSAPRHPTPLHTAMATASPYLLSRDFSPRRNSMPYLVGPPTCTKDSARRCLTLPRCPAALLCRFSTPCGGPGWEILLLQIPKRQARNVKNIRLYLVHGFN